MPTLDTMEIHSTESVSIGKVTEAVNFLSEVAEDSFKSGDQVIVSWIWGP